MKIRPPTSLNAATRTGTDHESKRSRFFMALPLIQGRNGKMGRQLTYAFVIAFLFAAILPAKVTRAQGAPPAVYTVQECERVEEAGLRDELNRITQAAFAEERGGLDVAAIVARNWVALNMDQTLDAVVEVAAQKVRDDTPFWERIWSSWNPDTAEDLATRIAIETFESQRFSAEFDELSAKVADDVVGEIRIVTAQSASSALLCVQEFLGDTFSQTMATVLEREIQDKLDEIKINPDADKDFLDILKQHSGLAGGVVVILGTQIGVQIAKRLAQKVAQNIVGKVVIRILGGAVISVIPIVGWIIGAVLIVVDIFDARDGALPFIKESLQSEEVKAEIRAWTAQEVNKELRTELPQLARDVANSVFSQWLEFRRKFVRVLELAETNARFRRILDDTPPENVKALADFVDVLEAKLGLEGLEEAIDKGHFARLLGLPERVLEMLEYGVELETVIAWADLAGDSILKVIEFEVYRTASPSELGRNDDLARVLALDDAAAIQKLILFLPEEREVLLGLTSENSRTLLLADLPPLQLSRLTGQYLAMLDATDANLLAGYIVGNPALGTVLENEAVRKALLDTEDMRASLAYLARGLEGTGSRGYLRILGDLGPVLSGQVPWALFWHKNAATLGNPRNLLYVLAGLIILYLLLRFSFRRRQPEVNVTVYIPESRGREKDSS